MTAAKPRLFEDTYFECEISEKGKFKSWAAEDGQKV